MIENSIIYNNGALSELQPEVSGGFWGSNSMVKGPFGTYSCKAGLFSGNPELRANFRTDLYSKSRNRLASVKPSVLMKTLIAQDIDGEYRDGIRPDLGADEWVDKNLDRIADILINGDELQDADADGVLNGDEEVDRWDVGAFANTIFNSNAYPGNQISHSLSFTLGYDVSGDTENWLVDEFGRRVNNWCRMTSPQYRDENDESSVSGTQLMPSQSTTNPRWITSWSLTWRDFITMNPLPLPFPDFYINYGPLSTDELRIDIIPNIEVAFFQSVDLSGAGLAFEYSYLDNQNILSTVTITNGAYSDPLNPYLKRPFMSINHVPDNLNSEISLSGSLLGLSDTILRIFATEPVAANGQLRKVQIAEYRDIIDGPFEITSEKVQNEIGRSHVLTDWTDYSFQWVKSNYRLNILAIGN